MRLFRSAPQDPVPKTLFFGGIAALWAAPLLLGWLFSALAPMAKPFLSSEAQLYLYGWTYLLFFSPLFSWVGWLVAAPLLWVMLRHGWFGWASAAALGAAAGAIAGALTSSAAALPFGLVALLCLRALLGWQLRL
ncbi:hypothetical protein EGN72_16635 [Pseudorhodobacter sp. E13]|uniref:hypothetical protein n=1 Tax=Pseudorhodobacter sp. E13 TaxID=2487931 RepID=UPI000F8ECEB1|nr:hypothetical protein [Pseudorhodobacter sp. E13]RUS58565.1 hypothetical protein EGN72_16635 [Pseudorhodobacter sp. E13]